MAKVDLHLGATAPDNPEATLQMCLRLYRRLTGKKPTPDRINQCRVELQLPPVPTE